MNRRDTKGRTLPELMVASAILLLLTAACTMALRSSMDYHRRIQLLGTMEEELLRTLGTVSKELSESSRRGIVWQTSPVALTFPTPRGADGGLLLDHAAGNRLRFQTIISYRVEGTDNQLRRYIDRLPITYGLAPNPLDLVPPRDDLYFAATDREYKRMATGVTNFTITPIQIDDYNEAQTVVSEPIDATLLRLNLRLEQGAERNFAVSAEIDIVPGN